MSESSGSIDLHDYIDRFRRKLVDLTRRNRLLSYKESKRTSIRIVDELPDHIYDHLVEKAATFYFDADEDGIWAGLEDKITDLADRPSQNGGTHRRHTDNRLQTRMEYEELQKSLNSIRTKANTAIEETGINYLFITLGFLEWFESPDSKRSGLAPLILIPVKINRSFDEAVGEYVYALNPTGEDIQSNYALIELMDQDFGVVIPEFDPDESPEGYFKHVSKAISNRVHRDDRWRIVRRANLGFFSFAKLLMYKDLDPRDWPEDRPLDQNPHLRRFFTGEGAEHSEGSDGIRFRQDYHIDDHPIAHKIAVVDNADSSQHSALIDIHDGHNLVIEGPPGTGKSQTITNAIAAAIAEGKSVLFVSEKLAALEVVRERLNRLGLGDFCLELHSEKATPRQLLDDLATRLGGHYPSPSQIKNKKILLDGEKQQIAEYLAAVTIRIGPHNEPLHDVFWRAVGLRDSGATEREDAELDLAWDITDYVKRCRLLDSLGRFIEEFGKPTEHPWFGFFCPQLRGDAAVKVVQGPLQDIIKQGESIDQMILQLVGQNDSQTRDAFRALANTKKLATINVQMLAKAVLPHDALPNALLEKLVTDVAARRSAEQFCKTLTENRKLARRLEHLILGEPEEARSNAAEVSRLISQVFSACKDRVKVSELRQLLEVCRNVLRLLDEIDGYVAKLEELGQPRPDYLNNLQDSINQHELMLRSDEFDWELFSSKHYLAGAATALSKAKNTAAVIDRLREKAGRRLRLKVALERSDLEALSNSLNLYRNKRFRFLSSEYRRLWRDVKGMLLPPAPKIDEVAKLLGELHEYKQMCTRLGEHRETATQLGPVFKGVDTDWEHADQIIQWATEARRLGLGYEKAKRLKSLYEQASDVPSADQIRDVVQLLLDEVDVPLLKAVLGQLLEEVSSFSMHRLKSRLKDLESQVVLLIEQAGGFNTDVDTNLEQLLEMAGAVREYLDTKQAIDNDSIPICTSEQDSSSKQHAHNRRQQLSVRSLIGEAFQGIDTDADLVRRSVSWCEQVADSMLPQEMREWVFAGDIVERQNLIAEFLGRIHVVTREYESALNRLYELGSQGSGLGWLPEEHPAMLIDRCRELLGKLPLLPKWTDWCRTVDQARQLKIHQFVEAAELGQIEFDRLKDAFELTFFTQLAESMTNEHPVLRGFTRIDIEEARYRFKELDEEVIQLERRAVAAKAAEKEVPYGVGSGRVKDLTQLALIEHEIPKQKRLCRVRQLMIRAQDAIKALKPCFMMSPLSVAQFLPKGDVEFDLVIFDEASQVKPEDAFGAIVRGKQVVVVGDPKQLPPTSFFDKLNEDEIDEDDLTLADETESILEVAMKSTGNTRRLKWHYRSEHESLIAFSNDRFYDGELVVFPSPIKGEASRAGVFVREIDGATYIPNRGNRVEAEAVATAIANHVVKFPDETLGVGTFNLIQRELIEECLDQICSKDALVRHAIQRMREESHETLFVKNLENLQGDERDVIFISYGWAPEQQGENPHQRFGPIGYGDGWRRLNVLVTRARKRVEVFASIKSAQIVGGPGKSKGVNAMKDYLEYAQTGVIPDRGVFTDRQPDSPFEIAVGRVLTSLGLDYEYQVGVAGYFIDLAVKHPERPGEFVLGIECDGATYHSAKSARDRDRLRESVIMNRGWQLHRVWSTDWFYNRESEIERLRNRVNEVCDFSI